MYQQHVNSTRAGRKVNQPGGYGAFLPSSLPPIPPILIDEELLNLLSRADQSIGRLDASSQILPAPDRFVSMYVRKEAVSSSQIEGTIATLLDVLEDEAQVNVRSLPGDVGETRNYVQAMNRGLELLQSLPVCNRLLKEVHEVLLTGVRGGDKSPGEFRASQNWIGPPGCDLSGATFVPPPPQEMERAMGDLEQYIHGDTKIPILLRCGLIHGQFECIHPFLDGNGRLGRLLITFLLCQQLVLSRPFLYLSIFFHQFRYEYLDRLQAIHEFGDWEGWLKFFLRGIIHVSLDAADASRKILEMREEHRQLVMRDVAGGTNGLTLLDFLYGQPVVLVSQVQESLNVSYVTANNLVRDFCTVGLLEEISGRSRNRVFVYAPYLKIFSAPEEKDTEPSEVD